MYVWSCLPWVARGSIAFIRKKRTVQTPEHKSRHRKRFKPALVCLRPKKTWGCCSDEIFSDKRSLKKCVEPRKKNRTQKIKHFFKRFYPLLYCFAWALCPRWEPYFSPWNTTRTNGVCPNEIIFIFFQNIMAPASKQSKQTRTARKKTGGRRKQTQRQQSQATKKQGRAAAAKQRRRTTKPRRAMAPPLF